MDNLKKHVRKVKKHKGLKVYPCRSCQFSCDDGSGYLKHIKQVMRGSLVFGMHANRHRTDLPHAEIVKLVCVAVQVKVTL